MQVEINDITEDELNHSVEVILCAKEKYGNG
jgi:hypothetical protein